MKIAFNPSTVAALITPPNNKDITFDLRGRNIFARGVKFCGTDTNTWRDIKINNVSIGSNILDLRNGSNTTLTNTNGVVTINSTWRPVVDNLTSDSTTSSLSAKQGKVLKSLIDGKSNSGHTHDDRYLKLTGGTMASNALITFADSGSWGTDKGPQGARGGLYWTGQSDYAKLYAEETVGDNLDLVIQFGDDNSNGLSIRNKANTQTSYISAGGVITTGTFKGNLDWSYITNKPSSYTPSAHTHAWNSLTHSSTTENQAILTNGKANGWKLYTLNISRWDNAANNAHSHANKSVLDGITSALVNNWNVAYTFVNTITGTDTDKVINKWDEIVNFLAGITEDNKLNTLLNSKLSIYELANNTNVGAIKNNGIYYSTTDASSGTLTNSPFNTGFALINMTSYDGGDDLRRSRLAFNAYGEIKVSNDRGQSNTTETWYQVLTSHNTYISNGSGIINGTTITQVSNADTTDGVHLEWSGQLTYDQYSWLAGWTNDGKKIKAVNKSQFATSGHTHDDRYLRLTGGWMSGDINFGGDNKIHWGRNTDSASISFKNDGDGDADSYMSFVTSDNGNEYFRWSHSSGSTNIEWMALRSDGLRVGGTKVSLEGHSHNDLYYTKTEVNNKLNGKSNTSHTHDDRYLKLTGGTMSGTIYRNSGGATISGRDHAIIRQTYAPGGSSWNPIACVDTETGTWTLGHLSSGSNNTDFNFCFSTNADYNAGNNNGNYVTLRNKVGTIALLSDIPSSLKNPHALTISLNGTSQGPYDGSTAKNINITPSSIGAATSDHNHDSYYVKYGKVVKSTADNTNATPYLYNVEKEEVISGYYNYWYIFNMGQYSGGNFGTQIAMPYQNSLADSELFIRSADNGSWRTWRRVLHSNNYSSILDSRYYTESEVDNLLDAKLNRQNLSYGTWNPRGYNLAADYYYNGGDLSISESGGKIHISVDGYFWQNEGQYRVLDTSDISSIRGGLTLYQHLSATDTTRYPLVWGGSDHKNTNNSTGSLYKSYDKLSWQTSSQTLYATNIQTENIKHLSIGGGIYWNPYVESTTDGSDSASITVVKSGVAGGTTLVLSQMNDANDTIQFKTNGSARLYHNSYPILTTQNTYVSNNKGYINGTEITQVNNADTLDSWHKDNIQWTGYITSADTLASYWFKMYDITVTKYPYNDITITFLVSEGYSSHFSIFYLRIRQNGAIDSGNYGLGISLYELVGNLRDKVVAYYNNSTGNVQLWGNTGGRWGTMNYTILKKTTRTATDSSSLGILTAQSFSSVQTLPSTGYTKVTMSRVGSVSYSDSTGSVHWNNVTNKPSTFTPAAHTHTVFKNNLMIKGTNGISDSASIHLGIGDSDTGFKWISDGKCQIYANNSAVGEWTSGGMNWFKNPTVNGNKIWNAGNDGSGSGLDADKIDGYHASSLWRSDGATWNPNANVSLNASGNNQEWSFDIGRNGYTGCYWHVWDSALSTLLKVNADNGKVYAPYNFVGNLEGNASTASKLTTARTIWGQSFDGTGNVDNTLRIRQTTGNYCEGIRIQTADSTWATIILGATGDSGTNANAWSIHRKSDNNFAISRNSSDGTNGLVMTSVGMGLGTTAPTQRLDVAGNIRTTGNLYISHVTNNNMNYNTSNPRIVFSESGSQAVGLVYTDYNSYRASKGLKVMDVDNDDTGNVWFEVQGYNYSSGYVKNGSSDSYVLLGGGGHKAESSLRVEYASSAGNADTIDGYHAGAFVKIKQFRFRQYNQGTWTKILTITINSTTDLQPVIAFSWIPSECSRTIWADFSINWRSNSPIFYAIWKGMNSRTLKVVNSSGAIWDVWVSGNKTDWDPFGEIQVTYTHNITSYNGGNLGYSDTDPGGTICITGGQVNYANSAGSATKLQTPRKIWGQSFDGTGNVDGPIRVHYKSGDWNNYNEGIRLYGNSKDNSWSNIHFGCDPATTSGSHSNQWFIGRNTSNQFGIFHGTDAATGIIHITTNNNVGIGTNAPAYKLDVRGNIRATGNSYATHFYESSDKTLKKNIKSILSSTNIPKIREFDWKGTGEHSYGFIAQELEEQGYGCLVSEANGKKTVNYTATLALTVAKLQNLINIQNKKISNLTKELKALKYGRKKNS